MFFGGVVIVNYHRKDGKCANGNDPDKQVADNISQSLSNHIDHGSCDIECLQMEYAAEHQEEQ